MKDISFMSLRRQTSSQSALREKPWCAGITNLANPIYKIKKPTIIASTISIDGARSAFADVPTLTKHFSSRIQSGR
jgi:hypothetical protein